MSAAQPITPSWIIRILVVVVVLLSLVAGYYHARFTQLSKSYHRLETKYLQLQATTERTD